MHRNLRLQYCCYSYGILKMDGFFSGVICDSCSLTFSSDYQLQHSCIPVGLLRLSSIVTSQVISFSIFCRPLLRESSYHLTQLSLKKYEESFSNQRHSSEVNSNNHACLHTRQVGQNGALVGTEIFLRIFTSTNARLIP